MAGTETVVAEVTRHGKLVYAEPYFEAGSSFLLEQRSRGAVRVGDLVVVRKGRKRASLERVLGRSDRIENVLEGLLVEKGRRRDFEPYERPSPSARERIDLRGELAFTIDPETAKDFDDAISVREEPGGMRVFVHIADVSAYLPAGVPLDYGAAERAFSTYVPGLVAPMLPPELSEDACSIRPNQDRLCVTTEILFDAAFRVGEPRFYRSVIRSRARLSYPQAERILSGEEQAEPELAAALERADRVSAELRRRRFERGALKLVKPELAFSFDGKGGVARAWLEQEPRAHALVEELMIITNEAVGRFLAERQKPALFRVHERPDAQSVASLLAKLVALEVPTPPAPKKISLAPDEVERLVAEVAEKVSDYVERSGRGRGAFPPLVLRALKQARYDPRNLGHSGLASRAYCHFTSPIRRYPDIVCHRSLLRELGLTDDPLPGDLDGLAERVSAVEREAAEIEYQADDICSAWLLEARLRASGLDERFQGEIVGLIDAGLFIRFGEAFEGFLPARRLGGDYYQLDPLGIALVGRRGGRYRLGDGIEVQVEKVERSSGKVELRLPESTRGRKRR